MVTSQELHAQHAIIAMQNRKHVIVEKPMALSIKAERRKVYLSHQLPFRLRLCPWWDRREGRKKFQHPPSLVVASRGLQ